MTSKIAWFMALGWPDDTQAARESWAWAAFLDNFSFKAEHQEKAE